MTLTDPHGAEGRETRRDAYLRIRQADGASAAFDYIAEEFYHDTGRMAPGKDVPAALGGDFQAGMEEFHAWRKQHDLYPTITRAAERLEAK